MTEETPTCQIHKKYGGIECSNPAMPGDPEGLCILHSQNKAKDPEAFREAMRAIWDREDAEKYEFQRVFFPGPFDPQDVFRTGEFKKAVNFYKATFSEEARFYGVTFKKAANFRLVTFKKEANFRLATFAERADFSMATFMEESFFPWGTFMNDADFSMATFTKQAFFHEATISALVLFQSNNIWGNPFEVYFTDLLFKPDAILRFQDLSLAKVSFQNTDLRCVEFRHVTWHPYHGRQATYDEVSLRQQEKKNPWFWTWLLSDEPYADPPSSWTDKYGEVERLYRDLQENYEKARDYKKMGDFHYGEMEMHRRANKWRWFPCYWLQSLLGLERLRRAAFPGLMLHSSSAGGAAPADLALGPGYALTGEHSRPLGDLHFYF